MGDMGELPGMGNVAEILERFRQHYDIHMTDENGEDGIPPNYIQDNIQVPILDIPEFCRKLQDKYDKEWESKERKDRDVETIKRNLQKAAEEAGIDQDLIDEELATIDHSALIDVPRLLDVNKIQFFQGWAVPQGPLPIKSTPTDTSEIMPALKRIVDSPKPEKKVAAAAASQAPIPLPDIPPALKLQSQPKLRKKPVIRVPELKRLQSHLRSPTRSSVSSAASTKSSVPTTSTDSSSSEESSLATTTMAQVTIRPSLTKNTAIVKSVSKVIQKVVDTKTPPPTPSVPQLDKVVVKKSTKPAPSYICSPCGTNYASKADLSFHWNQAHPSLKYALVLEPVPRCIGCLKTFPQSCKELTAHVSLEPCSGPIAPSTVLELTSRLRRCPCCTTLYANTERAAECLNKKHNRIRCYICLAMFPLKPADDGGGEGKNKKIKIQHAMGRHIKEFHSKMGPNGKHIYPCPFCSTILDSSRIQVEHLVESHYDPCLEEHTVTTTSDANKNKMTVQPRPENNQAVGRRSDVQQQNQKKEEEQKRRQSEGQPRPPQMVPGKTVTGLKTSPSKPMPNLQQLQNPLFIAPQSTKTGLEERRSSLGVPQKQLQLRKSGTSAAQQSTKPLPGDNLRRGSLEGRVLQVNKSPKLNLPTSTTNSKPQEPRMRTGPLMRMGMGPIMSMRTKPVAQYPGARMSQSPPTLRPRGVGIGGGPRLPPSPLSQTPPPTLTRIVNPGRVLGQGQTTVSTLVTSTEGSPDAILGI